jgi:hypothetical protein
LLRSCPITDTTTSPFNPNFPNRNNPSLQEEIAQALLAYDQSQVEYYSLRTKSMVGKVLTNNGVVEPIKDGRQITVIASLKRPTLTPRDPRGGVRGVIPNKQRY